MKIIVMSLFLWTIVFRVFDVVLIGMAILGIMLILLGYRSSMDMGNFNWKFILGILLVLIVGCAKMLSALNLSVEIR